MSYWTTNGTIYMNHTINKKGELLGTSVASQFWPQRAVKVSFEKYITMCLDLKKC